jgi:anti-sigma B factor antagonist
MVRPAKFQITQRLDGRRATLALTGELDMGTTGQLSSRVSEQLAGGATDLTVDLTELTFMDSSGLRALIDLHDRSRTESWSLKLIAPEDEGAVLVIRATGADKALPFTDAAGP